MITPTQQILAWMSDDQSVRIYENRIKYQETYDYSYIQDTIDRFCPEYSEMKWLFLSDELRTELSKYEEVIIAGAGQRGKSLIVLLQQNGFNVTRAVDNGYTGLLDINGSQITVSSPENIDHTGACFLISLSDAGISQKISGQLKSTGVPDKDIYKLSDYVCNARHLKEKEYFAEDIIQWEDSECFVDCGALDMETSMFFVDRCKKAGVKDIRIHAFEPDGINYERCINSAISDDESIRTEIYEKGVWSENTTLRFNSSGGDSARITPSGSSYIKVVKLDDVIDEKVTFIKMDIEGAELEALKGAQNIIRKYRPRLAVCLYHKPEDIVEIPMFIKELVPEYKLYVRHYSNNTGELVLYAII